MTQIPKFSDWSIYGTAKKLFQFLLKISIHQKRIDRFRNDMNILRYSIMAVVIVLFAIIAYINFPTVKGFVAEYLSAEYSSLIAMILIALWAIPKYELDKMLWVKINLPQASPSEAQAMKNRKRLTWVMIVILFIGWNAAEVALTTYTFYQKSKGKQTTVKKEKTIDYTKTSEYADIMNRLEKAREDKNIAIAEKEELLAMEKTELAKIKSYHDDAKLKVFNDNASLYRQRSEAKQIEINEISDLIGRISGEIATLKAEARSENLQIKKDYIEKMEMYEILSSMKAFFLGLAITFFLAVHHLLAFEKTSITLSKRVIDIKEGDYKATIETGDVNTVHRFAGQNEALNSGSMDYEFRTPSFVKGIIDRFFVSKAERNAEISASLQSEVLADISPEMRSDIDKISLILTSAWADKGLSYTDKFNVIRIITLNELPLNTPTQKAFYAEYLNDFDISYGRFGAVISDGKSKFHSLPEERKTQILSIVNNLKSKLRAE